MILLLKESGYPDSYLRAVDLIPSDGANIPAAEQQLAPAIEGFIAAINAYLKQYFPSIPPKTSVDLISHSMGSMSSRWYTARVRADRVRRWISLGGANHGTNVLCGYSDPGSDDLCPAYAQNEQESYIQYILNGTPYTADVDETPYGVGKDSSGTISIPADRNRRILYVTIRTSPDVWISPETSVILDGAGGVDILIPSDLPAIETAPGNILITNGVGHDAMLSDQAVMRLVNIILNLPEKDTTPPAPPKNVRMISGTFR